MTQLFEEGGLLGPLLSTLTQHPRTLANGEVVSEVIVRPDVLAGSVRGTVVFVLLALAERWKRAFSTPSGYVRLLVIYIVVAVAYSALLLSTESLWVEDSDLVFAQSLGPFRLVKRFSLWGVGNLHYAPTSGLRNVRTSVAFTYNDGTYSVGKVLGKGLAKPDGERLVEILRGWVEAGADGVSPAAR
jgi:hypothetical protein